LLNGHPQASTHITRFRRVPLVNVLLGDKLPRPDRSSGERDRWARAMMILFKPWRSINDLKSTDQTWTQAFESYEFTDYALALMENMNVENQCKDARDAHEVLRK
ncbi:hypothetical protein C8R44DRAFT_538963, partial [Mycena epipterygia]